ncbi:MAG: prepilin-type N-terminal cleavage/methylation domain-containing protein [Rhodocyclaceae bacterium]|nr:prepilin-type N-terminal cleavage/methylation domain-containing protein [Rhodocyclaceae bacterium]MBX3670499.1 prepilin-type N-terminal cleavage/methylation domain-containing protein [Rhodocyclaceae bacterium]
MISPARHALCPPLRRRQQAFTLAEMLIVMVVTGIIAAVVAIFVRAPMQGYFDSERRARLAAGLDAAAGRLQRDLRLALPNSVRVAQAGGVTYLEFLLTSGGGRYRAEPAAGGAGDILDFTSADSSFDVLGPAPAAQPWQYVVVSNFGPGSAADAYAGNAAALTAVGATNFGIAATRFVLASSANRFQVVETPVTYACDPAAATLRRYSGYAIAAVQPTPPAGSGALLATQVSACSFTYDANPAARRMASVALQLALTEGGETLALFQQIHVSNQP